jgi:hypothetical protein
MDMICNLRMCTETEIDTLLSDPETFKQILFSESEDEEDCRLNLDKTWHAIHFLLCGSAWRGELPLGFILMGGTEVKEIDAGHGPAHVFKPAEVKQIAEALEPITRQELRHRFNGKVFAKNDIYPEIWGGPLEQCLDQYVLEYFEVLKEFIAGTRDAGNGLIVYMT